MDELYTLTQAYKLLDKLDANAQKRCMQWLCSKLDIELQDKPGRPINAGETEGGNERISEYSHPSILQVTDKLGFIKENEDITNSDRALIIASYLQEDLEEETMTAREINEVLKSIGYQISNITMALNELIDSKPQKLTVLQKQGSTKQAQKLYKVTDMGFKHVKRLLMIGS
jgi:hypothetical protein